VATVPRYDVKGDPDYPVSDGKPMAESDRHRPITIDLIEILEDRYATDPRVYVSGNLMSCHEQGDKRKHVAPDVLHVRGLRRREGAPRLNSLVWDEGKAPTS
jgi:hypothetical protein